MRRRSRQCALQILYQLDANRLLAASAPLDGDGVETAIAAFWTSFEQVNEDERAYAERVARGVAREIGAIDAALVKVSENWRLERMDVVDRNLLRLAAYEIMWCPDIPRAASINEAVEMAKRFGGAKAAAFVNGLLDRLPTQPEDPA